MGRSIITSDPASLAELHRFCGEGRLYDVDRWIAAGNPLQLAEGIRGIAWELVEAVRDNMTFDWTIRDNVRAMMRVIKGPTLQKYGYQPDKQEKAS
ncbi:type I restriction enzyme endonuclease domain-containing protein [Gemmatimonadota bacterium]